MADEPLYNPLKHGTFPGDLERTETGHTRHCDARRKWGDGECECGFEPRCLAGSSLCEGRFPSTEVQIVTVDGFQLCRFCRNPILPKENKP